VCFLPTSPVSLIFEAFIYTLVAFSALIGPVVFKSAGEIVHPALFGGSIINHRFVVELETRGISTSLGHGMHYLHPVQATAVNET